MDSYSSPFFVVGFQRSGTTLVRRLLGAHPELCIPPECSFITFFHSRFGDWSESDNRSDRVFLFANAVAQAKKFEFWDLTVELLISQIKAESPTSYRALCSSVYRLYCSRQGKPNALWGDKNNVHGLHLDTLSRIFPNARIIHVIRDPRDVFASEKNLDRQGFSSHPYSPRIHRDPVEFATSWTNYLRAVETDTQTGRIPSITVRYEYLLGNPQATAQSLFTFLEIVPADNTIFTRLTRDHELELPWKDKGDGIRETSSASRFRELLSPQDADTIEVYTKEKLKKYGYP